MEEIPLAYAECLWYKPLRYEETDTCNAAAGSGTEFLRCENRDSQGTAYAHAGYGHGYLRAHGYEVLRR